MSVEDVVMTTTSADTDPTIESSDINNYIYVKNIPLNDQACTFILDFNELNCSMPNNQGLGQWFLNVLKSCAR